MTCTNFPKDNLVPNVTQHQVGNVTYQYKGNEIWEAITAPLNHDQLSNLNTVGGHDAIYNRKFDTLSSALSADFDISAVGTSVDLKERESGKYGGATWDIVLASSVTLNPYNKIQCTGNTLLALVLSGGDRYIDIGQIGGFSGEDISPHLQFAVDNYNHVNLTGTSYNSTTPIIVSTKCHRITGTTIATNMRFYGCDGFVLSKDACEISHMTIFSLDVTGVTTDPKLYTGIRSQGVNGANRSRIKMDTLFVRGWAKCFDFKYTWNSTISKVSSVNCLNAVTYFGLSVNNHISDSHLLGDLSSGSIVVETVIDTVTGKKGEGLTITNSLIASGNINIRSSGFLSLNISNCVIDLAESIALRLTNVQSFKMSNSWVYSKGSSLVWDPLGSSVNQDANVSGCTLTSLNGFVNVGGNNNNIKLIGNDIIGPNRLLYLEVGNKNMVVDGNNFTQTDVTPTLSSIFAGMSDGTIIANNTGASSIQRYTSPFRASVFNNFGDNIVNQGTWSTAPTQGTWKRNDIVYNSASSTGQPIGWVCVVAGTPGTWGKMPNLTA